jgi:hypothetical protein
VLRQEMNIGYFNYIHRPGEKLGVLDNASDFEECRKRTHCNATHAHLGPAVRWDDALGKFILDESGLQEKRDEFHGTFTGKRHSLLGGGEHNNVYFPGFYHYRKNIPEALMQDIDGNFLELKDPDILDGKPIPMPAIDDPTLLNIYAQQLGMQAESMRGCHYVAGYVMGAEMLYPEYFGLGNGDYRPVSWKHFQAWCESQGEETPAKEETLVQGSEARNKWLMFREQAMADRAAFYYQAILAKDNTHLCFYPTHGSFMHGDSRARLCQQPDSLISACDGIEMGHILVDHDSERRNVMLISHNTSFGGPVIVPRLGNKTPDLGMAGGGRSFTPQTLRRFVYECAGLGISIIYPIHWRAHLHDGEWRIKDTPAELECRKVFDELTLAAPFTTGMGRLQPQIGLLACDDTWRQKWRPQWTGLVQDAYMSHDVITVVSDALVDEFLPAMMPVLLSVDNHAISIKTLKRLKEYLAAGGNLLVWGTFAEAGSEMARDDILSHPKCKRSEAPIKPNQSVLRELFLWGYQIGTNGPRYRYDGIDYSIFRQEFAALCPNAIIAPFFLKGNAANVNVYALTDRASMIAVLVNNGGSETDFTISPDSRLIAEPWSVYDAVSGDLVDMPISLSPYATRMLCFTPCQTDEYQLEETICAAEDAFEAWMSQGMDIGALRHYYSGMRSGAHKERRFAMASAMLSSLAIKPSVEATADGGLIVRAQVLDAKQDIPENATAWLRLVPGHYQRFPLIRNERDFVCCLSADELPLVYDPNSLRYHPVQGPMRIVIQAEADSCQGGCIVNYQR